MRKQQSVDFSVLDLRQLTMIRETAGSDLGPNVIEVPATKLEVQKEENETQGNGKSSSNTLNSQSTTRESEKSGWWPF